MHSTQPISDALVVHQCVAGYGGVPVLQGLDFSVGAGEVFGLLGRNGSGRSTLVKVLSGLLPYKGEVHLYGERVVGIAPHQLAGRGLSVVSQNRNIFPNLTVLQNLQLGWRKMPTSVAPVWTIDRLMDVFPVLGSRLASMGGTLSGGEQQMLSLARALLGQPRLLVVDEASEGLSPMMVEQLVRCFRDVTQSGCSLLLIEQKPPLILALANRVGILGDGVLQFCGTPQELVSNPEMLGLWLGAMGGPYNNTSVL